MDEEERDCGSGYCGKCPECRERLAAGIWLGPSVFQSLCDGVGPHGMGRLVHPMDPNIIYAGVPGEAHFPEDEYEGA